MNYIIQELRCPWLSLVQCLFPYQWQSPCTFWHVLCLACKYLIFLLISELASILEHGNSLLLSKNTKNTQKTKKTVVPSEINLQSKHNLICHVAKVEDAMSAHSLADAIPLFSIFIISFESNASINPKENIFLTH